MSALTHNTPTEASDPTITSTSARFAPLKHAAISAVVTAARTAARVALYVRLSTLNQGQETMFRLEELRRVAAQRGWVISAGPEVIAHARR